MTLVQKYCSEKHDSDYGEGDKAGDVAANETGDGSGDTTENGTEHGAGNGGYQIGERRGVNYRVVETFFLPISFHLVLFCPSQEFEVPFFSLYISREIRFYH